MAFCQSAVCVSVCVCVCVSLSPHPPSLLPAHNQQSCHLPQPLYLSLLAAVHLCVHHTSCFSRSLPALFNKMTLCPFASRLSACSPTRPSLTLFLFPSFSHPYLPPSIRLSFRLSLPRCGVSLHINRTLVTAFSASSCLLSPSCCSISSITYLHTPTPLSPQPLFPSCSLHPSLSPSFSPSPSFPLCPSCPLPPSVLTIHRICHPNPPSFPLSPFFPPSPPSLPFPLSCFPPFLSISPYRQSCTFFLYLLCFAISLRYTLPPLPISLCSPPILSFPPSPFP